jgi:hypothetical protein
VNANAHEHFLTARVGFHGDPAALDDLVHLVGIAVDHQIRHVLFAEFVGDDAANAAVAADDEVIFDVFQHAVEPAPREVGV